jgi:hypothetical protein
MFVYFNDLMIAFFYFYFVQTFNNFFKQNLSLSLSSCFLFRERLKIFSLFLVLSFLWGGDVSV